MAELDNAELQQWLVKIAAAKTRRNMLSIMEEFRVLPWTDEQCSTAAKLYMRLLLALPDDGSGAVIPASTGST
ncbi:hypothetical protein BH11CYA1_BH11CYA1_31640 [soil metagenome]